jgi:hypothetical protein
MKNIFSPKTFRADLACFGILLLACTQFPTQLGYISDQKIQTVGFVFTNSTVHSQCTEGAPGDTMHLHAHFAGEPIRNYACSISTQYSITQYGSDTAINFKPVLDPFDTVTPDSVCLSFVIPQNFFAAAGPLIKAVLASIPDSLRAPYNLDSARINSVPPSQLPAFAGLFLTTTDFSTVDTSLCKQIAYLAELLSGQTVLHFAANGGYTITRNIIVRYNSHIRNNRFVFVNNNPDSWWIAVYKVKNRNNPYFGPADLDSNDTMICLYAKDTSLLTGPKRLTDTVLIDTGFTYYAAGDSGRINSRNNCDSVLTKNGKGEDTIVAENYSYLWFYQPDTTETNDLNPLNALSISNDRGYYSSLAPPLDTAMHNFTIWARVSESASGELNGPTSVSVRQVSVVFEYSEMYASKVKKK